MFGLGAQDGLEAGWYPARKLHEAEIESVACCLVKLSDVVIVGEGLLHPNVGRDALQVASLEGTGESQAGLHRHDPF